MKIESEVTLDSNELRELAEQAVAKAYPAPAGMAWKARAKYAYIPDVTVVLVKDKPEHGKPQISESEAESIEAVADMVEAQAAIDASEVF